LSFDDPGILVGNMISDFVKGKTKYDFPLSIQKGIYLHRQIDRYTDEHAVTREAKEVFKPIYRLYSGAFVDVVYDHFLAADENEFSEDGLLKFSLGVYTILDKYIPTFPPRFAIMYPFMKSQNWLFHYRWKEGAEKSMSGVVRRARYLEESQPAHQLFREHYQLLQQLYRHFWADLKPFARQQFEMLENIAGREL
jgi:acyl carrier protein phosphodiesterase